MYSIQKNYTILYINDWRKKYKLLNAHVSIREIPIDIRANNWNFIKYKQILENIYCDKIEEINN